MSPCVCMRVRVWMCVIVGGIVCRCRYTRIRAVDIALFFYAGQGYAYLTLASIVYERRQWEGERR